MPYWGCLLFILIIGCIMFTTIGLAANFIINFIAENKLLFVLSVIPAALAHNKGKKWINWFVYGFFLWPVAMVQILLSNQKQYGWVGEKNYKIFNRPQIVPTSAPANNIQDSPVSVSVAQTTKFVPDDKSLDDLLAELNNLTGLDSVKQHLNSLFNKLRMDEEKKRRGLPVMDRGSLHMVFTGNPGTGKTTVARLISRIYKQMGILTTGAFVEADRNSLIGQYIGQTGPKTLEKIEEASGGVLFIDEAYSLYHEDDQRDFGQEAITTLLKAMEDKRDDLIVIVAGYTNEMNHFIDSNPGLKSRFTTYIEFPDYSPDELMTIFRSMCKDEKWILNSDANDCLYEMLEKIYNNKTKDFGNARTVRNIFQKICMTQNNRISNTPNIKSLSNEEIMTINKDDIIEASKYFLKEGAYHA